MPLHHRLYSSLLQQITDGVFASGTQLPGEHELGTSFNVSRATVRRALLRLEEEGLVWRKQGSGTFVKRFAKPKVSSEGSAPLTEHVGEQSSGYESRCLEFAYIPTPPFLDATPEGYGPVVLKLSRLTLRAGQPVHLHVAYVPERFGRHIDMSTIGSRPVANLLKDLGFELAEADLYIEAAAADSDQAELLEVSLGAPLIRGLQLSKAPNGSPLEYNLTLSRPDRFRYCFRSDERQGIIAPIPGIIGSKPEHQN